MSTYSVKGSEIKQDRLYIYGSSRLGEFAPGTSTAGACDLPISEDDIMNSRDEAISGLLRNVFSNMQDANFDDQVIAFWQNKWASYFQNAVPSMSSDVNNVQTHIFIWNAWSNWMCKMRCFEGLNQNEFSAWNTEWSIWLRPFTSQQITCSISNCPNDYSTLLSNWNSDIVVMQTDLINNGYTNSCTQTQKGYVKGSRHYELSNHLGNVLAVVSDRKIEVDGVYTFQSGGSYSYQDGEYTAASGNFVQTSGSDGIISAYVADVIDATDYYAFGSPMPNRVYHTSAYKFAFNGKEKDDETYGNGNVYDYGFRIYNPRLGKFLSVDPLTKSYPELTPFQFASNMPIWATDLDGLEARFYFDISVPVGHAFISVIDNNGILHVYTYGQYGQGHKVGDDASSPVGTGALVHLVGDDANRYIRAEFSHYKMTVYEDAKINKDKVMEYFSNEMSDKPAAEKRAGHAALTSMSSESGSCAVQYGTYSGVMPDPSKTNNCVTIAGKGARAGGDDVLKNTWLPQGGNHDMKSLSKQANSGVTVIPNAYESSTNNNNGTPQPGGTMPGLTSDPVLNLNHK